MALRQFKSTRIMLPATTMTFARSKHVKNILSRFLKNESGATAIEYGLIAAFLSVCLIAVLPLVTGGLNTAFTNIGTNLTSGGS
jgi:pilus assembly protein Flp/PilA